MDMTTQLVSDKRLLVNHAPLPHLPVSSALPFRSAFTVHTKRNGEKQKADKGTCTIKWRSILYEEILFCMRRRWEELPYALVVRLDCLFYLFVCLFLLSSCSLLQDLPKTSSLTMRFLLVRLFLPPQTTSRKENDHEENDRCLVSCKF